MVFYGDKERMTSTSNTEKKLLLKLDTQVEKIERRVELFDRIL